ncbi:MAG TPA: hypothetical protein VKV05_12110, partial [Terriglobales bacterium]|nr:hypothetical protein [Terriglobales bacterium]
MGSFEVKGLKELEAKLSDMREDLRRRALRAAMRSAGNVIKKSMIALLGTTHTTNRYSQAKDQRRLREDIGVRVRASMEAVTADIGPRSTWSKHKALW